MFAYLSIEALRYLEPRFTEPHYFTKKQRTMRPSLTDSPVHPNPVLLSFNCTLKNWLQLLSEAKIEELHGRPDFDVAEQELYCTIVQQEMGALRQYSATKTRVLT